MAPVGKLTVSKAWRQDSRAKLEQVWTAVCAGEGRYQRACALWQDLTGETVPSLPLEQRKRISGIWHGERKGAVGSRRLLNRTYQYVLINQSLAKLTRPEANALSLQKKSDLDGAWSARSHCVEVADFVISEISRPEAPSPLGRCDDPYVSKPTRCRDLNDSDRDKRDPRYWNSLRKLFRHVEQEPQAALPVLIQTMCLFYRDWVRLAQALEAKPPAAPSTGAARSRLKQVLHRFAETSSGGERSEVIVYATLQALQPLCGWDAVIASDTTTADDVSDSLLRRICDVSAKRGEQFVYGVDVSDERLRPKDVQAKLDLAATRSLVDVAFVVIGAGFAPGAEEPLRALAAEGDRLRGVTVEVSGSLTDWVTDKLALLDEAQLECFYDSLRSELAARSNLDALRDLDALVAAA